MRWQHPTRGLLYPDAFLTLVEQSGVMGAMTRMIIEAAVGQLAAWRASDLQISVAVNLSASICSTSGSPPCLPCTTSRSARYRSRSPRAC